jgi:HD-like signal output (HDOD) protein
MISVLFVDDTEAGLGSLRKSFASCLEKWKAAFVGPDVALYMMAEEPVDAVVSSARLARMSAAEFLGLTKERHPGTARIALSDPGDRAAMLRTLPVANQCLSTTCGSALLAEAVERTTKLQSKLFSEATRRLVVDVGELPSLPSNIVAIDAALSDENVSLGQIANIMSGDVAMVAKVIQLVNSSYFGLRVEIRDLRQAVAYLGVEALRDFAIAGAVFRAFKPSPLLPDDWLASFNAHAMAVSDIASQLVRTSAEQCEANVAGTLHDIGELVVAERAPAKLIDIAGEVSNGSLPDEAEIRHIGTTYPVIGGYLLSLWGMGHGIVEAIACQRETWSGPAREPGLADVIHVADCITASRMLRGDDDRVTTDGRPPGGADSAPVCQASTVIGVDEDYQERVGLLGAVRLWEGSSLRPAAT